MDPTLDPTPGRSHPQEAPAADLAAILTRVTRIEQRIDGLEAGQRWLTSRLTTPGRPNPPITPIHAVGQQPAPRTPPLAATPPVAAAAPTGLPRTWLTDRPPQPTSEGAAAPMAGTPPVAAAIAAAMPEAPAGELDLVPATTGWRPSPTEPSLPAIHLPDLATLSPGRLLAWVGGAALVLGAVFFLSLAFSRGWITEPMRVLIGLVGGALLMGASVVLFDRRGPVVAHVLAAAGIAILELSLYAARLFDLVPAEVALLGTAVVAAIAMVIAIRVDSQPVAALGLLAVLAAPPIMQAPATLVTVGFLFIVLVAVAAVAVARGWRWLPWLAFATTAPQLFTWLWGNEVALPIAGTALLGYWGVIAAAATGEMWRRSLPVRQDPSSLLLGSLDLALLVLWFISMDAKVPAGIVALLLGGLHVAAAMPFLRLRFIRDPHGQLLIAAAVPWITVGLAMALPEMVVPVGLAALAAVLGALVVRWQHAYAQVEGLLIAGLAVAWVLLDTYPIAQMTGQGFPPVGEYGHEPVGSLLVVAGMLAVITAASRWSAATDAGRSAILAAGVVLAAWAMPFHVTGLWLVAAWMTLAVVTMVSAIALFELRPRRLILPGDPLLLTGAMVGVAGIAWALSGFPRPTGTVDLLAPVVVERLLATLLPVVGLGALIAMLRTTWWRGVLAGVALMLLSIGVWMIAGAADLQLGGPGGARLEGELVVLIGWSTLALAALVLDERPRLRLASPRLLTRDPIGHPLVLAAILPAVATLFWLLGRFLSPGMEGGLPTVPFADQTTLATGLVVGFLVVAAAVARTRLVRSVLVVTAVVLIAVLLPIELPIELAVVGWSVMAALTMIVSRRLTGAYAGVARIVGAGLIAVGTAATLLVIAPPDRLVLELTRVPPDAGPPNAATLVTFALAGATGVAAWCCRGVTRHVAWLWLAAGGALGWGISIAIADAFAMRIAGGAEPVETARQAQVALSIAWATMGLGTMLVGLLRDVGPARQAGLALLALATVKVFVYDLATLDIAYRVLSLVGLGLLLLVSAWLYPNTRHRGGPQAMGR